MTGPVDRSEASRLDDGREVLDLQVATLRQLFNAMDPAPFHERELDANADEYIVEWARETRAGQPLGLSVRLTREAASDAERTLLREAVHEHFRQRAASARHALRQLFRTGRISLAIGLAFLAAALGTAEFLAGVLPKESFASIVKESLVIGGWVALWRPLEIFLYDWWPLLVEARLFDRLGAMEVTLRARAAAEAGA
jgi:hypothetical protein